MQQIVLFVTEHILACHSYGKEVKNVLMQFPGVLLIAHMLQVYIKVFDVGLYQMVC